MRTKVRIMIATMAFMFMYVSGANAQEIYQSTKNGISVQMPKDVKVVKDDATILYLQANDFVFSAHPMNTENLTPEKLAEGMAKVAEAYGVDINDTYQQDFENETLSGSFFCCIVDEMFCAVGSACIKDRDDIIFMFTITAPAKLEDEIDTLINSLEFKVN